MASLSDEELYTQYMKKLASLRAERASHIPVWTDIRDYFAPYSALFEGEKPNDGIRRDSNVINPTPLISARTLPAGMQSGITSPMRPWFRLGTPDPDLQDVQAVKEWLADVERLMREVMTRSNLYDKLKSTYSTLGNYGTAVMFIDEHEDDVLRAYDLAIGTWMCATDSSGVVSTVAREIEYTTIQMMDKFKDDVSDRVKEQYAQGNYASLFKVCHFIEPNKDYVQGSENPKKKRYVSIWFDVQDSEKRVLRFRGYNDKPFMAPRWDVVGEATYGQGCGHIALGDGKQLQLVEKRKLQGIDKNVSPTMVADASLRNKRQEHLPGSTTYVNGLSAGAQGYKPAYQINPYVNELREEGRRIEMRIDEAYYKNLFMMVADIGAQPNITATQISAMREEKLMMLGPVLERLNDELLDPMIDRVFNIMLKRDMLPPPPEEIQGIQLRVEYVSILAQAQKSAALGNIERFVGFGANLAQLDPSVIDKMNLDGVMDEYADGSAVPPSVLRTNEDAATIREARQEQENMAQQMQMGEVLANATKTLSEADMSGENVLTKTAEQMGGSR